MPLKKKEIENDCIEESSAFSLPSVMSAMSLPQTELPIRSLTPAPDEWNFFSQLPDGKFLELCDSIAEHGIIHPLMIYETAEGSRIILSGHNRVRALNALFASTGDSKYLTVPCMVRRDLSEQEARDLLIDANWTQRTL